MRLFFFWIGLKCEIRCWNNGKQLKCDKVSWLEQYKRRQPPSLSNKRDVTYVINGNVTNNINGQGNATRNGFLGLGSSLTTGSWNTDGPISVLYIMGEGTNVGTDGYRNWMRNAISLTHNQTQKA